MKPLGKGIAFEVTRGHFGGHGGHFRGYGGQKGGKFFYTPTMALWVSFESLLLDLAKKSQ